jgi:hypothetical protein
MGILREYAGLIIFAGLRWQVASLISRNLCPKLGNIHTFNIFANFNTAVIFRLLTFHDNRSKGSKRAHIRKLSLFKKGCDIVLMLGF